MVAEVVVDQRETIGERVRRLREGKGMSQQDLARAARVSLAAVTRLEGGRTSKPQGKTLDDYAQALGTTWRYLLTGDEEPDETVREVEFEEFLARDLSDPQHRTFIKVSRKILRRLEEDARKRSDGLSNDA